MNGNPLIVLVKKNLRIGLLILQLIGINYTVFSQKPLNPIADNSPKSKIELIKADSLVGENSLTRTQTFLGNVIFRHRGVLLGCQKAIHDLSSNYIQAYGKIVINQGDTLTIVGDTLLYDGNTRFANVLGKSVILRDKKVTLKTTKLNYDLNRDQAYYPVYGTINQDSSKLSSKEGYYNTKTKFFRYIGDVEILNPSYLLCTDSLDYNTYTKEAIFKSFTTIKSRNGDLSAYKGKYNIKTKVSAFHGRAKVANISYSLEADTLNFDNISESGLAVGNVVFISFSDSLKVIGNKGQRIGNLGLTKIMGETITERIANKDTLYLASDTLWVYEKVVNSIDSSKTNLIKKPILITDSSKSNAKTIDSLKNLEVKNDSLKNILLKTDSLKIVGSSKKNADSKKLEKNNKNSINNKDEVQTIVNIEKETKNSAEKDKKKDIIKIVADGKVKVFRKDFQSVCDSLIYNIKDSMIYFYTQPIIWNLDNQLEADSVIITLKNNKLKQLKMIQNGFVISQDTISNFNQIKGRKIDAYFDDTSALKTIKVEGNGESLYFALDEKNKIVGLNMVQCSSMQFNFGSKKIKQITFKGNPESTLISPKEITKTDMNLEKFEWKTKLKPTKNSIVSLKFIHLTSSPNIL